MWKRNLKEGRCTQVDEESGTSTEDCSHDACLPKHGCTDVTGTATALLQSTASRSLPPADYPGELHSDDDFYKNVQPNHII
jgi:hypothetical protein